MVQEAQTPMPRGQAGNIGERESGAPRAPLKRSHCSGHCGLVGIWPQDAKCPDFSSEIPIFM